MNTATLSPRSPRVAILSLLAGLIAMPAMALTGADIDAARYEGGALPEGQTALTARLQVLLDRAGVSVAVIDGYRGGMTESALRAFEARQGLPVDGRLDAEVWTALGGDQAGAVTQGYTIAAEDVTGLAESLPDDYAELAERDRLPFTSVPERLAERFHMDEDFLRTLNPESGWTEGETITVMAPGADVQGEVARIVIDKPSGRLSARDADGREIANYPVAVGSAQTPSPSGKMEVLAVAVEPTYTYRPDVNFQQGDNDEVLTLPPGPNGPVGLVWIDLEKETYGIHGTPEPARLFVEQSHGCVRMTNWDAMELAHMVGPGVVVEFAE